MKVAMPCHAIWIFSSKGSFCLKIGVAFRHFNYVYVQIAEEYTQINKNIKNLDYSPFNTSRLTSIIDYEWSVAITIRGNSHITAEWGGLIAEVILGYDELMVNLI